MLAFSSLPNPELYIFLVGFFFVLLHWTEIFIYCIQVVKMMLLSLIIVVKPPLMQQKPRGARRYIDKLSFIYTLVVCEV